MFGFLIIMFFCLAEGHLNNGLLSISITRHHKGDIFITQGEKCFKDLCVSVSGGTATSTENSDCECKCSPNRPVFRDDLNICVDDIQECGLVPFASSSVIKKIPYVFLPLKGQIVYPSADITISDAKTPVCVVSGGQFLGQNGWTNLRNNSGPDVPFTLFRDEGKTYLQWLGESSLRMALEGRIILVHLLCKDASSAEEPEIFSPCIAFRVAGNPSVKEMLFATDVHLKEEYGSGLRLREYVAIGVCSLLLAIVYVAAVFLYLHIRKRKQKGHQRTGEDAQLTLGEEGVIKSNPLLQATRHLSLSGHDNAGYISESNSCCSDTDQTSDLLRLDDDELMGHQNMQTSAIIHPCDLDYGETTINQDSNNIEKLPEENVSIVETLEVKETHPETIRGMGCANGRRKLYFNPSYFEPDLLKAPPPAAMEFLIKIREVIAIAKHKMSAKKFSPSLLRIPEEDGSSKTEYSSVRKESPTAEKTETRETQNQKPEVNFPIPPNEWPTDTKQKIIRKWLEDVPVMILQKPMQESKVLNKSKLWRENLAKESNQVPVPPIRQEKRKTKGKAPPVPPLKIEFNQQTAAKFENPAPPRPPPMPTFRRNNAKHPEEMRHDAHEEIPRVQGKDCVPPAIAKNLMDAVIQELTSYKKNSKLKEPLDLEKETPASEPTAKQTVKEETIEKEKVGNRETKTQTAAQDDHEYEIILLHSETPLSEEKDLKMYNLPEILSKSERTEGYSLVSEVYVNDGYSCCSGESPPSSYSNASVENVHYDTPNEKPGRLTIHVNDSPERYRNSASESENFEPDTLDRKPRKVNPARKRNEESERYSNQKFHDMESSNINEKFTDSLERPSIMLKTNGTFKRNLLEKEIDDLFRNFSWTNTQNVGSLREIYEAKSKTHKRRTETTSLIGMDTSRVDHDRLSTLSWCEERRNKLLHRGIVLHIKEKDTRKHKRTEKVPQRPPEVSLRCHRPSPTPRSRSTSPITRANCVSPPICVPSRTRTPPLPPPRSSPSSPSPGASPAHRSPSRSPVPKDRQKGCGSSPVRSPGNSIQRRFNHSGASPSCSSPTRSSFLSDTPPPRPPKTFGSPLLPPRSTKPPLPPKNVKRYPKPGKFAGRPLPPLPRPGKDQPASPIPYRDPESLSTHSGASIDSLNSSDYEAFYTLPYEEEEGMQRGSNKCNRTSSNAFTIVRSSATDTNTSSRRSRDSGRKSWRGTNRAIPHRQEDSGYLSTDSDSCCPRLTFPSHLESGSQNSETEESLCDGASESGGESIATDSFFYGNFKKKPGEVSQNEAQSEVRPYALRLSDVEVNSDTERRCIPIMVRP